MSVQKAVHKSVPVYVPEPVWRRMVSAAEDRDVPVEDILVSAVKSIISPVSLNERIVNLARVGWPDKAIAAETGALLQRVGVVRRRAGIPARRWRAGWEVPVS